MPTTRARRMWQLLEPVHAVVYFAPEARDEYAAVGLKGDWMGYFASRAAPLGAVPAEVVIAAFYNFAPAVVRRAVPDAWRFADPQDVVAARLRVADRALRRLLGDAVDGPELPEVVELLRLAVAACDLAGRPLFAAHLSLPWPDEPHLALWHGATLLREHRGDGHVAALVAAGLDGCEAHVSLVESSGVPDAAVRPYRAWTDEEWAAAAERLRRRGWTAADRHAVEDRTDELAAAPWRALDGEQVDRLESCLRPLADRIAEGGGVLYPNPMGLTRP